MSAAEVRRLEDLLARVQKNREARGVRLALPHEAVVVAAADASAAADDAPITRDFAESEPVTPAATGRRSMEATWEAEARRTPSSDRSAQPVEEPLPEPPKDLEAPEIVLDEASHDVILEDGVASVESVDLDVDGEPEVMTRPKPTLADPRDEARAQAAQAAAAEPLTQPRPAADAQAQAAARDAAAEAAAREAAAAEAAAREAAAAEAAREAAAAEAAAREAAAVEAAAAEAAALEAVAAREAAAREAAARAAEQAAASAAAEAAALEVAAREAPSTAAPATVASTGATAELGDPDAVTTKRAAKEPLPPARRPPPLPGSITQVSEPPEASVAAPSGAPPAAELVAELDAPPSPLPAPVLAAAPAERKVVVPIVAKAQLVEGAKVAELIGEIAAAKPSTFGSVIDDALSLTL